MLGHFIDRRNPGEEHNLLTGKLGHYASGYFATDVPAGEPGCLLQTMGGSFKARLDLYMSIGLRYDMLVRRFGIPRIANAIRNRIFANQVRRKLTQPQPEYANT